MRECADTEELLTPERGSPRPLSAHPSSHPHASASSFPVSVPFHTNPSASCPVPTTTTYICVCALHNVYNTNKSSPFPTSPPSNSNTNAIAPTFSKKIMRGPGRA